MFTSNSSVAATASNKTLDRRPRSESLMVTFSTTRGPGQLGRYTLSRISDVSFAAPSLARTYRRGKLFESVRRKRGRGSGLATTARLLLNIAHNNCVQRSAASEFLNIASILHATPADAKR
jgi:hypothetical protein